MHPSASALTCGDCVSMPACCRLKAGDPSGSVAGSGKFGTPWARMHSANLTYSRRSARNWAFVPPLGIKDLHAFEAAGNRGDLLMSFTLGGSCPLALGSGKFGTPWARTHRAKASSCETNDDDAPPVPVDDGLPLDDGLPPHAAVSSTRPAVTARTPARRGRAPHQRRRPPVLWFMVPSSWLAETRAVARRVRGRGQLLISCVLRGWVVAAPGCRCAPGLAA